MELKSVAEQTYDKGLAVKSIFTHTVHSPRVYLNLNFHLRLIVHDLKLINFNFLCKHDGYVSNLYSIFSRRSNSVTWNPHKLMGSIFQCSTIHFKEDVSWIFKN